MTLGENIFRLRSEKNMSQGDLADALDVSRQSVSKWENNNAVPELDKLIKLSELFGISLDDLVNGPGHPIPESNNAAHAAEANKISPTQKVIGIFLLCSGFLLLLVIFQATSLPAVIRCLLVSVPLVLCGTICLRKKHHAWLLCLLIIYGYLWLPMGIFSPNYTNYHAARIMQLLHLFWGIWLIAGGFILKKQRKFFDRKKASLIYYTLLVLTCLLTLLILLFPALLPTPGLLHG